MERFEVKFGTPTSILFREYDKNLLNIDIDLAVFIAGRTLKELETLFLKMNRRQQELLVQTAKEFLNVYDTLEIVFDDDNKKN